MSKTPRDRSHENDRIQPELRIDEGLRERYEMWRESEKQKAEDKRRREEREDEDE